MSTNLAVHSLHALAYCERLFYLENVEHLRVADERVFAGRRLHVELERKEDEGDVLTMTLESARWGLMGKVDCIRRRDGMLIPYEHKRGRAARSSTGEAEAWWNDKLQVFAYAALVEEHSGQTITEGRIRYHADNVMVRVVIDDDAWRLLAEAVARARELQATIARPPVTANERLCAKCSLAPVCLPEEARLGNGVTGRRNESAAITSLSPSLPVPKPPSPKPVRLFPADDDRQALHVVTQGARVGRKGDRIEVAPPLGAGEQSQLYPVNEIGQVVLHGFAQISTQALGFLAQHEVGVHWLTNGGRYLGAWSSGAGGVQRRIRQYKALTDSEFCLRLAKQLTEARVRGQMGFLIRASRESGRNTDAEKAAALADCIRTIRKLLGPMARAKNIHSLRGYEGSIGAQYFKALPHLISDEAGEKMKPDGRTRRPPRDRANALLSFGYALLMKDVLNAILVVGLDPSLGFYHQPRSQAHPLALDLMELFRVPLVDLPVIASINRRQWDEDDDFTIAGQQVWLSASGRKKLIAIYERRKQDQWKHPVIGYSLSYARLMELEVRLLEKEWMNEGGLFARMRLR
ncbi:MAG: type I-MYXAN CRISPR-associated endonuclease Cas1 [Acidobacteriota bacterium]|nr:type I-MYXAN CRISPR-associated endonuclease Cas1 [Acidobacteriota bacterium]